MAFTFLAGIGSNLGDGLRVGSIKPAAYDGGAWGLPVSPSTWYVIKPYNAAAGALRTAAIINAAGSLPLAAAAGSGITVDTYDGYVAYILDVARAISFTGVGTGGDIDFTIRGWDFWMQEYTEEVTLPAGGNTAVALKIPRAIRDITASAASGAGSTVAINTTNVFGLPYKCTSSSRLVINWNGVPNITVNPANSAATLYGTFTAADTTNPATATTGDVRGKYALNAAGVAPNNARELAILQYNEAVDTQIGTLLTPGRSNSVPVGGNPDNALNNKINAYGVPQYRVGW